MSPLSTVSSPPLGTGHPATYAGYDIPNRPASALGTLPGTSSTFPYFSYNPQSSEPILAPAGPSCSSTLLSPECESRYVNYSSVVQQIYFEFRYEV